MQILRPGNIKGIQVNWFDSSFNGEDTKIVDAPSPMRIGFAYRDREKDLFYALGFYDGSAYQDKLYSYNPKTGEWLLISEETLSARGGSGYHLWKRGDWLYWGLGYNTEDLIHRYNLVTDTFESNYLSGINAGRASTCAYDEANNTVYSFGERLGGSTRSSIVSKIVDLGGENETVVNGLAEFPGNAHPVDGAAVYYNGYCYVKAGGPDSESGAKNPTFKRYDVEADEWQPLSDMPVNANGGGMWVYNGDIYYHFRDSLNDYYIHKYLISSDTWVEFDKNNMPLPLDNYLFDVRDEGREAWLFGGRNWNDGSSTVNDVQVISLDKPTGRQQKTSKDTRTGKKLYRGIFYRDFRVRITQSSQAGSVFYDFITKDAPPPSVGIQVKPTALVDIRQVHFKFHRIITFQSPESMNVQAYWKKGDVIGEERNYEFIQGCENGLDIDEFFRPKGFASQPEGYTSKIIDMSQYDTIQGGYIYNYTNAGQACSTPNSGSIEFTVSIPADDVIAVVGSVTEI